MRFCDGVRCEMCELVVLKQFHPTKMHHAMKDYCMQQLKSLNKLALVVPVYNVARYLRECLDSLLVQTNQNFIVFAVDDGSPDNSGAILDEYAKKDSRIRVIHQKNGGVSVARNTALEAIEKDGTCDYIGFLDPDDYVSPKFVECLLEQSVTTNADCAACSFRHVLTTGLRATTLPHAKNEVLDHDGLVEHFFRLTTDGKRVRPDASSSLFLGNRIIKASLIRGQRFNTTYRSCEDQDFFIRTLPSLKSCAIIADDLHFYRMRASSSSKQKNVAHKFDVIAFEKLYNERTKYSLAIQTGLQDKYLNALLLELTNLLSSDCPLHEKQEMFAHCLNVVRAGFDRPLSDLTKRRIARLKFGFLFNLFYAKYHSYRYWKKNSSSRQEYFP